MLSPTYYKRGIIISAASVVFYVLNISTPSWSWIRFTLNTIFLQNHHYQVLDRVFSVYLRHPDSQILQAPLLVFVLHPWVHTR